MKKVLLIVICITGVIVLKGQTGNPSSPICANKLPADYWFHISNQAVASVEFNGITTLTYKSIVVEHSLNFDQSMNFTDCDFFLGPNAEILISSGITVTFEDCLLESCNDQDMWEGVKVLTTSSALTMTNTTLREAVTGIEVDNGGQINLVSSTLQNNHKGVVLNSFSGNHPAYFQGTEFIKDAQLLMPFQNLNKSFIGIEINDVSFAEIGQDDVSIPALQNKFINFEYGIKITESNVDVLSNVFMENAYGVQATGNFNISGSIYSVNIGHHESGLLRNLFKNNFYAHVLVKGTQSEVWWNTYENNFAACVFEYQPVGTVNRVFENNFENNQYGIWIAESLQPQYTIQGNLFNVNAPTSPNIHAIAIENTVPPSPNWVPTPPTGWPEQLTIDYNEIKDYEKGIQVSNTAWPKIRWNKISRIPANFNVPSYGIRLFNCPSAAVEANEIAGLSSSIWAGHGIASDFAANNLIFGNCVKNLGRGIWVGGQSIGVKIRSNTMKDCNTGFFANYAYIGTQGWYDETGTILRPSDNEWDGNFTNHLYNFEPVSSTNSFVLRGSGSVYFIPGHLPSNFQSNKPGGSNYPPISYPVAASLTNVNHFYGYSQCTFAGWSLGANSQENSVLTVEEIAILADTSSLNTWVPEDVAVAWLRDQALYRELVQDTVNPSNSSAINTFIGNTQQTKIDEIENIDELIRVGLESGILQDIATAEALNTLLAGTELPMQTTANFNSIYLPELEEQDLNYDLPQADINTLQGIAQLCPYIYGTSVYQARAMLKLADTTFVNYSSPCELGYQNGTAKTNGLPSDAAIKTKTDKLNEGIQLSPNPASNLVMAMFTSAVYKNGILRITTGSGQLVLTQHLLANLNTPVALPALPTGVYYCTVVVNKQVVASEKLVVQN